MQASSSPVPYGSEQILYEKNISYRDSKSFSQSVSDFTGKVKKAIKQNVGEVKIYAPVQFGTRTGLFL
jgi:hypothetical protein